MTGTSGVASIPEQMRRVAENLYSEALRAGDAPRPEVQALDIDEGCPRVLLLSGGDVPSRETDRRTGEARSAFPGAAVHPLPSSRYGDPAARLMLLARAAENGGPTLILGDAPPPAHPDRVPDGADLVLFAPPTATAILNAPALVVRRSLALAEALAGAAAAVDRVLNDPAFRPWRSLAGEMFFAVALSDLAERHDPALSIAWRTPTLPLPAPAGDPVVASFGLLNKQYREAPFDDPRQLGVLAHTFQSLGMQLRANAPGGHAFMGDEMITWFRRLGFLDDTDFRAAVAPYRDDTVLRARLWRLHTLCWAARACRDLDGDFVDLGCYDGQTFDIVSRYSAGVGLSRRYWLYDLFEDPPEESRKQRHGPALKGRVEALFADRPWTRVTQGRLPDAMLADGPPHIAFAHLDLNSAEAEQACLDVLVRRLVPGGMLVLDDFGFQRYADSQAAHRAVLDRLSVPVLELPTGQGLAVKPVA
jgi:hypothetical protein